MCFPGAKCFLSLIVNDLIKIMLNTWDEFARKRAEKMNSAAGGNVFMIVAGEVMMRDGWQFMFRLIILSACCWQFSP